MATGFAGANGPRWARWANLVLGVWLFISAFLWPHLTAQRTNTWILGVLFAIVALVAMSTPQARWLNAALSIWLFLSVWALPHQNLGTMWNNALVAIVVFLLSLVPEGGPGRLAAGRAPA
ncbi:MAG TPA: SPW repeat protein [Anaeromyxobacter sp.]|nr:SPW repeat protein [Anaeromyxobacter sp.]